MPQPAVAGVPRIIHQTWRSSQVPPDKGDPASWQSFNPQWEYRFWSDEDLLAFMESEFPDLLGLYLGYERPVQRADFARYCLLKRFGGLYADIDTRCLASLEPLADDPRVILCEEPLRHHDHARRRGVETLYFNGTMASPAGHPFWELVIDHCKTMHLRRGFDVLDTTGPMIVTAAALQWPDQSQLALSSSNLFARLTTDGSRAGDPPKGPHGHLTLSEHLWQGSWFTNNRESWFRRKMGRLRKLRHTWAPRRKLTLKQARAKVDETLLRQPLPESPELPHIAILIPVRDGEPFLLRNFEQILGLDYPMDRLHIVYGEGLSEDRTRAVIRDICARKDTGLASIRSVQIIRGGPRLSRAKRWRAESQLPRRAGIAMARNDLLKGALNESCDWFLWLDADIIGLPRDLIVRMLAARAKIVTPDCVMTPGGESYDLNSFLNIGTPTRADYYRNVRGGLFQPPADFWVRRHLHDLRYLDRVPLDCVGGTALLVHADVHRAGLDFPELPFNDLIETEAFGAIARALGVTPIGLPRLQILHAPT